MADKRRRLGDADKDDRIPVRLCSAGCTYRQGPDRGCKYYLAGKVETGDPCLPDQMKVTEFSRAFEEDDMDRVKREAGRLVGALYLKACNMLEIIMAEGLIKRAPQVDKNGEVIEVANDDGDLVLIWIEKPHPLIEPFMKAVKLLGMDIKEFGLTPTSKAKRQKQLTGNLTNIENIDIKILQTEQHELMEAFRRSLDESKRTRENDPVFQQFIEGTAVREVPEEELRMLEQELDEAVKKEG